MTGETDIQAFYEPAFAFAWPESIAHQAAVNGRVSAGDVYVHERLAILASRKHGLAGWNLGRFNWEWLRSLKVYRLEGTTRWGTPHAWR